MSNVRTMTTTYPPGRLTIKTQRALNKTDRVTTPKNKKKKKKSYTMYTPILQCRIITRTVGDADGKSQLNAVRSSRVFCINYYYSSLSLYDHCDITHRRRVII